MTRIRTILITVAALAITSVALAQSTNLEGSWSGTLNTSGGSLRLIFHIEQSDDTYEASVESVDQGGAIIPLTISVEDESVRFTNAQYDIDYQAEVSGDEMSGTFIQFGSQIPGLTLTRGQ
jgi:hypothetical protein